MSHGSIDLAADLSAALKKRLQAAKAAQQAGDAPGQIAALDGASRLLFKLADVAPTREVELERKRRALAYREQARRLREGEAAPVAAAGEGPGTGAAMSGEAELETAVQAMILSSPITWNRIGGLEDVKRQIKYTLGLTLARAPQGVKLAPWRNILLYGPPGTGKTLLAAATSNAIASEDGRTAVFYNVKVSSVLSKYFGESTKIISELYGSARDASPAVVFLDEFESLCATRDGSDQSGAERRILSTILAELDGLAEKGREDLHVITIAATNRPWDIDPAVLSRFEKQILIPLPDEATRKAILELHIGGQGLKAELESAELVSLTQGLSGREIERVCKEAVGRMVAEANRELPALVDRGLAALKDYAIRVRPLRGAELREAARGITPQTGPEDMARYRRWAETLET